MPVCQKCGKPVPADAPLGHCPHCLLDLGSDVTTEATAHSAPTRFGDYELLEPIGRGGMGVVYKARQVSLKRCVALKMLHPHSAAFPAIVDRLRLEAETLAGLRHPHIVTIHDVAEHNGQPFFTMELIEGVGMDKLIGPDGFHLAGDSQVEGKRRGPHATVVRIMARIARAVDYAHKHGVLHRDLKPANVLIDPAGEPHLTDFGLAKVLGRERALATESGMIMGTAAYMSPEQAAGETKRVSTASDVHGLGAILYAMLTGRPPFHADTPVGTLDKVINEEPKHPSTLNHAVDRDLATICLKCLEKDPPRRYSSAQAVAEDLERWLRHEPIEARPVRQLGRAWRWCQREPTLATMTAGLLLLLTATAVLALTLYQREREKLREAEQQKNQAGSVLDKRIYDGWLKDGRVLLSAQDLALKGNRPYAAEGDEMRVVLGVDASRPAANVHRLVLDYVPLLNSLQADQPRPASGLVLFELQIYAGHSNALQGLRNNEVDLMRLDPAAYVLLRQTDTNLTPIVQELLKGQPELRGAIFTRADSDIKRLEDLKGQPFAFGIPDSAVGHYLPKATLVARGLSAGDFQRIHHFSSTEAVITAVRRGQYAAGAAKWTEVSLFTNLSNNVGPRLTILREVSSPGTYVWVATKKLAHDLIPAIQERLVSLRDTNVLATIDPMLTGFRRASATNYDALESLMEKAKQFDGPRSSPPAQPP